MNVLRAAIVAVEHLGRAWEGLHRVKGIEDAAAAGCCREAAGSRGKRIVPGMRARLSSDNLNFSGVT